jgi:hypothetical protein
MAPYVRIEEGIEEDTWVQGLDEPTIQFDFDQHELTAEAKVVIGYLTMEEHGIFGGLSVEEQQRTMATLRLASNRR